MDISLRGLRIPTLVLSALCAAEARAPAQWVSGGLGLYTYDKVGIGTSWLAYPLTVFGSANRVIYGLNYAPTGTNYGVVGRVNNGTGAGVLGEAASSSGAYGVHGLSSNPSGVGVRGESTADFGTGVRGSTESGYGVSGSTFGGFGVVGWAFTPDPGSYAVYAVGNLGAGGTKTFLQPHPTDASTAVQFICLEGNEAGTYFRGTTRLVNGKALIPIPDEWRLVTDEDGISVQVTPLGPAMVWVASRSRERIAIAGSADVEFDYTVNGVRRGFTEYQPYVPNRFFRPEVRGVPFGIQYPAELRDILVSNGILHPDYTPNEVTAQRLGWDLKNPDDVPVSERYWLSAEQRRSMTARDHAEPPSAGSRNR